jgi:DNA-binding MarR family transcriptional regulator
MRPTDSAITRATQRLLRMGFVLRGCADDSDRRGTYAITPAGRERVTTIVALTTVLNHRGDSTATA